MRRVSVGTPSAVLCLVALASVAVAQTSDHLACYKIKDPVKLAATVDLDSAFGLAAGCRVNAAKLFCVPSAKTVVEAVDRATGQPIVPLAISGPNPGDRICYKVKCPLPSPPDTQETDQFGTRTLGRLKAFMLCTPAVRGGVPPRFVDNGDGTVIDNHTGLQWEKKTSDGSIHDQNGSYRWSSSGTAQDGEAFTEFLSTLNDCTSPDGITVTGGFAGHCDWRVPTIAELQSILLEPPECSVSPCIDPIFGPTAAAGYWSSAAFTDSPTGAWFVSFNCGNVLNGFKTINNHVRAVRNRS